MSELNNQSDLLQQLQKLRSEKELLEKHVFLLNDCLSVEELKAKISDLERKQETLIEMEDMIDKLRVEIEPLNYLKSILENKLVIENKFNKIESSGLDVCKTSARYKYLQSQNIQSIPTDLIKTNPVSSQKLNDKHFGTTQTLSISNTRSFVNDGSLDECMQLLDQYDIVTDQEMLNFSEDNHSKTPSINQESTISVMNDTDNENEQTVITSSVDVKGTVELKNEENNLSIEKNAESSLDNFVNRDITNLENCSSQFCEASTSLPFENKKKSDPYSNLNDFLLNMHTLLLEQEIKKQIVIAKETEQPDMSNASRLIQPHIGDVSNLLEDKYSDRYSDLLDSEIGDCLLKIPPSVLKDHFQKQGLKTFITSDTRDSSQKLDEKIDETSKSDNKSNTGDYLSHLQQLWKNLIEQSDSIKVGDKSNELLTDDSTTASSSMKERTKYNEIPDKEVDLTALKNKTININEPTKTESNPQKSSNTSNSEINVNSFNDMNLKIDILRGIYSLGFVNPTVLQQRVIVHCLNGRDVIVFCGSNNGRTMMFTIPLLQRIKTNLNECQALILVPTQNSAEHIQKTIMTVGDFLGVNVCISGDNVPKKLSVVPHVIIGTPAGVSNIIECKSLRIGCIQTVVINKADMMLTQNFVKLIKDILEKLVKNKQVTVLTSDKLDHILDLYMDTLRDPLVIINPIEEENKISPISLPKQFYLNIQEEWKLNALCEINETLKLQRTIIFCNTFDKAHTLHQLLHKMDYSVSVFNMKMSICEREKKLYMFSSNSLKMIITADPIEGYHFQHAAWIINYDLPINPIHYINRIVKCAENIKVLNLINENDDHIKSTIEKHIKSHMIQMPLNMMDLLQY